MTDSPPPPVASARTVMKILKDAVPPPGNIRAALPDALRNTKGLRVILAAMAEFIETHQEGAALSANKTLLERLKAKDGRGIADQIAELTFASPDEIPEKTRLLRETLTLRDRNLFEAMNLAVRNIARDHGLHMDDAQGKLRGRSAKDDKDTWAEFLHKGPDAGISDEDIRKAALGFDKAGIDDAAIKDSANFGKGEFKADDAHLSDYERGEKSDVSGRQYIRARTQPYQLIVAAQFHLVHVP